MGLSLRSKLAVLVLMSMVACSPEDTPNPAGSGAKTTQMIDSAGGEIELEGTTLKIPAGAIPNGQEITVTSSTKPAPEKYDSFSPVFVFEPAGLEFTMPVTIEMKASVPGGSKLAMFWTKKGSSTEYEELPSTQTGGTVRASITHFSSGFIAESLSTDGGVDGGGMGVDAGQQQDGGASDAGAPDAGPSDAGTPDAGPSDAGTPDAGPSDAGSFDGGSSDAGSFDGGASDAGSFDGGASDAGTFDGGASDAGSFDGGASDAGAFDGGASDAGAFDGGASDAGAFDGGASDAGSFDSGASDAGSFDGGASDAGAFDGGAADAG